MKRILWISAIMIMLCSTCVFAAEDYKVMTNEQLDIIIEENNESIEIKSTKLTIVSSTCIELMKKNVKSPTPEFQTKINEYTLHLKDYTEKIRVQKETCAKKSSKVTIAKTNNKRKTYVKKQQIKHISSQNKLISTIKQATKEANNMKKYLKSYGKTTAKSPVKTPVKPQEETTQGAIKQSKEMKEENWAS